jgi:hypothetical protein
MLTAGRIQRDQHVRHATACTIAITTVSPAQRKLQVNAPRGRRMAACPGIAEDAMV